MRMLGLLLLLVAMLGWSAWFVICNIYEFAPALDLRAFLHGWLIALLAGLYALRRADRRAPAWLPFGLAAWVGLYLLSIHRGLDTGIALLVFVLGSIAGLLLALRGRLGSHPPAA